ncbi:MAG: endonuclease/exonuclease/phosphatase family protein [Dehalococcoidia bacterium]
MKITSWNVAHLDKLLKPNLNANQLRRREAIVEEISELDADVLLVLEGPKGEAAIDDVAAQLLNGEYVAVKAADGLYATSGTQWIWFLVKPALAGQTSLLPVATWDALCGQRWPCYFWGDFSEVSHGHYRHPQVLVLETPELRAEFIGLHLKSKFVNQGERLWNGTQAERQEFIREALKARVKLTTEATNVRRYIDRKFEQVEHPAIFVMGDLNDGPGKEYFEERYLFFDLISNIQGDVFFANKFLNHALFDGQDNLRWSVDFEDFVDPQRDPHILLDHVLFTQPLTDGSLSWEVQPHAGLVEHEIHALVNAPLPSSAKTSDHRPVSVQIAVND